MSRHALSLLLRSSLIRHLALLSMLVHFMFVLVYTNTLHHDNAQYLTMGRMLLYGAEPFVDVVDTNPPTIMVLSIVPNLLSDISGLDIVRSFNLSVTVLMMIVFVLIRKSLRQVHARYVDGLEFVVAAVLLYTGAVLMERLDYGQRDHLIVLMLLPYVFQRAVALQHRRYPLTLEFPVAVLAVLAISMKPMFLLLPIIIEIMVFHVVLPARQWRLSRMVALMVALGAGLLAWQGMRFYVFDWSVFLVSYYKAYGFNPKGLMFQTFNDPFFHISALVMLVALLVSRRERSHGSGQLVFMLLVFASVSYIIFIMQGKGFIYHLVPFGLLVALIAGILPFVGLRGNPERRGHEGGPQQ
jgi:hypothetical protein